MRRSTRAFVGLVIACAAFAGACDEPTPPDPPDYSCEAMPDPHCDHPIDRLLIPKLRELGVPIAEAAPDELCRRMAIDLLARGPTEAELATCQTQTAGQMFDAFTTASRAEWLREQRRAWGELFVYNNANVWPEEIMSLDNLVRDAYDGAIDYAELATMAATHPALYALHPDDSWTSYVWNLFLGRPARADEIESMRPLTRAWGARAVCDGDVWWNFYTDALNRQLPEAVAVQEGHMACYNVAKVEWGFNLCGCQPGFFSDGCASDALGRRVEITAACPNPSNYSDPANYVRATARLIADDGTCPDGTVRPECNDRILDYTAQYTFLPFFEWAAPSPQLTAELRGIGDALIARGDFWEAAADRELRKFLGWWQTTFRHPDSDLPAVRTLLADELRAKGSLAEVQRRIATSLLYIQPGAAPAIDGVEDMAPWIAGPTKLLAGEAWLVTAASAVGETAGKCDFRWVGTGYFSPIWTDPNYVENYLGSLDTLRFPGYSIDSIVKLSGCNSDARRPEVSNIGLVFNQADISRTLCAYGTAVTPPGYTNNYVDAANHLIRRIWQRAPRPGEAEAMAAEMTGCVAAGMTNGCRDHDAAARWLCLRMLDSAEFGIY